MRKKSNCSVSERGADGPGRAGTAGSAGRVAKVVIISVSKGDGRDQTRQGIPTRRRVSLLCKFRPLPRVRQRSRTAAGMQRYSIISLARNALSGHERWQPAWRSPEPKPAYDVVIVGAGGHGLATAYYLAKEHGITDVAVIERSWLGGGNTGRNTTICRSNYLYDESAGFYDHALKLWEGLSQELNYNVMFSPRGVMMLAHTVHDVQVAKRHIHANRLNGVDNEWLTPAQAKAFCPPLNLDRLRYPVLGAALQRRGGTARHDAVAWGFARGADSRGVDIIQNCEVTGIRREGDRVLGVETGKGFVAATKGAVGAAGHTSVVTAMGALRMPLESTVRQALVSEPVKPVVPCVVMSNT